LRALALVAGWSACAVPAVRAQEPLLHPLHAGLLVIESVRDSTQSFRWVELPELGRLSLLWEGGVLFIPADLDTGTFGLADLTVPYGPELEGASAGRRLVFAAGRHRVDQPLLLADGRLTLILTRGVLEIGEGRIVYRRSAPLRDQRAQYLLLAGILLLTISLMVRLRRRLHAS
jgi:hypothetical protein